MKLFEKTLTSETKFEGRIIKVLRDTVELENGKTSAREVVRRLLRRDAAHHDRLLGRQYKYVFRHGRSDPCAGDHSCAGGNSGP